MKTLQPPAAVAAFATVALEGQPFRFYYAFDERLEAWHLSAYTSPEGRPIAEGWKLTDGQPVGLGAQSPRLWRGELFAINVANGASLTTAEDLLEGRSVVAYESRAEIASAPAEGSGFIVEKTSGGGVGGQDSR